MFLKRKAKEWGTSISQTVRCPSLRNGSDAEVFNNNRVRGGGAETKQVFLRCTPQDLLDRFDYLDTTAD